MNGIERRQYEMLLRVRDFGNTYREPLAASPVAAELLAAITTTIDDLTTADMQKRSASGSARADRKAESRQALIDQLLTAGRLTRVLRDNGHTVPPCDLKGKSDQALLTAGRQLAVDAAAYAEFKAHGIDPAHVSALTEAFTTAAGELGTGRSAHIAARARIQDLIEAVLPHVRRLDVVVATELAADPVAQTVWKQARRLKQPRVVRAADEAEVPATPPPEKEVAA